MKKRILFLGGSSLLAHEWCNHLGSRSEIILGIHNRIPELKNCTNVELNWNLEEELELKIRSLKLDFIINCVGYTNIENCEINPKQA